MVCTRRDSKPGSRNRDAANSSFTEYADAVGTEEVATGTHPYDHACHLTGLAYTQFNSTGLPSYSWMYDKSASDSILDFRGEEIARGIKRGHH